MLTVRETLQFSRTCQQKAEQEFSAIEEVRKLQQTGSKVHTAGAGGLPPCWHSVVVTLLVTMASILEGYQPQLLQAGWLRLTQTPT